jgi:hypothetical protein
LIAADCSAYARGDFHNKFMAAISADRLPQTGRCDYGEKTDRDHPAKQHQKRHSRPHEVPCCGGLENAVKKALRDSGKIHPWQVVTLSTNGEILD